MDFKKLIYDARWELINFIIFIIAASLSLIYTKFPNLYFLTIIVTIIVFALITFDLSFFIYKMYNSITTIFRAISFLLIAPILLIGLETIFFEIPGLNLLPNLTKYKLSNPYGFAFLVFTWMIVWIIPSIFIKADLMKISMLIINGILVILRIIIPIFFPNVLTLNILIGTAPYIIANVVGLIIIEFRLSSLTLKDTSLYCWAHNKKRKLYEAIEMASDYQD